MIVRNVLVHSSFQDYYDNLLSCDIPVYIFNREYKDIGLAGISNKVRITNASSIETKYCYVLLNNKWYRTETINARLLHNNKKAFPDEDFKFIYNNLLVNNKCYSIETNIETGEQRFTVCNTITKYILQLQSCIGKDKLVFRNEINTNLTQYGFNKYLSKDNIANDIITSINGGMKE